MPQAQSVQRNTIHGGHGHPPSVLSHSPCQSATIQPLIDQPTTRQDKGRMRGERRDRELRKEGEREEMPKPILLKEVQVIPQRLNWITKSDLSFLSRCEKAKPSQAYQNVGKLITIFNYVLCHFIIEHLAAFFAAHLINRRGMSRMSDRGQQQEGNGPLDQRAKG